MDATTKRRRRGAGTTTPPPPPLAPPPPLPTSVDVEERVAALRRNAALLYDCLIAHAMQWGSLSVCWGALETNGRVVVGGDEAPYPDEFNEEHSLYFSGRTDGSLEDPSQTWLGQPAELFVARVALPKPRTTRRNQLRYQEMNKSSRVAVLKRIIHPGEVNRVRALTRAPHLIVAHADSPTVFLWDTKTQPHRAMPYDDKPEAAAAANGGTSSAGFAGGSTAGGSKRKNSLKPTDRFKCSIPDLELVGHTAPVKYALDSLGSRVLSGSSDGVVLWWDAADYASPGSAAPEPRTTLRPRARFAANVAGGHTASVEDCCFSQGDESLALSVGQDRRLLVWDVRCATDGPCQAVADAHSDDVNCCSWSGPDPTRMLTGGSDRFAKVWDTRKLGAGAMQSLQHAGSLLNVRWSPHSSEVFAATDESSWFTIYRGGRVVFRHLGHRSPVVDFGWSPTSDYCLASVSDDSQDEARGGGGTLHVWRVSELIVKASRIDPEWARELEAALRSRSTASLQPQLSQQIQPPQRGRSQGNGGADGSRENSDVDDVAG